MSTNCVFVGCDELGGSPGGEGNSNRPERIELLAQRHGFTPQKTGLLKKSPNDVHLIVPAHTIDIWREQKYSSTHS
jgi:hypothetical protein